MLYKGENKILNRINNNSNGKNRKNINKNDNKKIKDKFEENRKKGSKKREETSRESLKRDKRLNKRELQNESQKRLSKKEQRRKEEQKQEPSKKKKGPIRRFLKKLFILLFLAIIVIGILFYKKVQENGGGIKGVLITVLGQTLEEIENLETIHVLLLGVSEDLDSKLTDTIIVCSYNPQNSKASMLSIPRDTFIGKNKDTAKGNQKINALYSKGAKNTLETVSKITGIDIDYYAVINNDTLIKIVDIIGEIDFEVPIDMDYDDETQDLHIHLKKGMQKINGEKAEQLLRFRHNNDYSTYPAEYGDNDYGRMKTQRNFITETIKQALAVKNVPKARIIIETIFDNIETNLKLEDLLPYVPTAVDFSTDSITSEQLPGESEKCNNLWFYIYDKDKTKTLVKELEVKIK